MAALNTGASENEMSMDTQGSHEGAPPAPRCEVAGGGAGPRVCPAGRETDHVSLRLTCMERKRLWPVARVAGSVGYLVIMSSRVGIKRFIFCFFIVF